jgi:hypothetical protein
LVLFAVCGHIPRNTYADLFRDHCVRESDRFSSFHHSLVEIEVSKNSVLGVVFQLASAFIERTLVVPEIGESQYESSSGSNDSGALHFHSKTGDVDLVGQTLFEFLPRYTEEAVARIDVQNEFAGCSRDALIHRIIDTLIRFADPVIDGVIEMAQNVDASVIGAAVNHDQLSVVVAQCYDAFE